MGMQKQKQKKTNEDSKKNYGENPKVPPVHGENVVKVGRGEMWGP